MWNTKKTIIISFIFVMILGAFGFFFGGFASNGDVEDIYKSIKNLSPKYQVKERIVTYQSMGMNVVCTLTTPVSKKSQPVILLLHGFACDRHGAPLAGTNEGYLDRFARILAENGFCVLRPDMRGTGDTGGGYELTTFTGQRTDAIAALDFIRTLGDPVDYTRIGMAGHSQGGLVTVITSAVDDRIKSTCILAAVAHPTHDYQELLLKEGVKRGIAHAPGTVDTYGLYVEGNHLFDVKLVHEFFEELFSVAPLVEVSKYTGPLMYISNKQDMMVWPQPQVGMSYMKYHDGEEKLVFVDSGHNFSYKEGPEKADEAGYWMTAWFIHTLKNGKY